MNNKYHGRFFSAQVATIILTLWAMASCRQSPNILPAVPENAEKSVLIINSDKSVDKYATIQREFESTLEVKTIEVDIAGDRLSTDALQNHISSVRSPLVYAIGSKAYTLASTVIKNKALLFSSMINWRRFEVGSNTYGIALELPAEMQLFMCSYLFPEIRTLGVLYSEHHNRQWFDLAVSQANEVGLTLHGKTVDNSDETIPALKALLPKVDALWLISDPIVLYNTQTTQTIFAETAARQKPIFAYNTLFSKYGAVLTISADIPTMGRQAAGLALDILKQQTVDEKVQFPAGSQVTLNLKKVQEYGIKINHAALSSVGKIIQ